MRDLHVAALLQALALGLALGIAWGTYTGWPRPPAIIPGVVTVPAPDASAVPLPRFASSELELLAHSTSDAVAWQPRARPARPAGDGVERPVPAPAPEGVAGEQDPPQGGTQGADGAGGQPDDLQAAFSVFDEGYELYRQFVAGEGSRSEMAPRARAKLNEARELLELARRAHRTRAASIERAIEQCDSYLGFLVHYGGF